MTSLLAVLWLLGATPAVHAAVPAPKADLSWALDGELVPRAKSAREDAARLEAAAKETDRLRAGVIAKRDAAEAERAALAATLATLSGKKKTQAEARLAEIAETVNAANARAATLAAEAAATRAQSAGKLAFAASCDAENATRTREAADRIETDAELGGFSDERLSKATAWWKRRLDRVPKQLAAIETQIDHDNTQNGRAALIARAESVRADREISSAQIDRIAEELRYRADTKSDESKQADLLAASAAAKSAAARDTPEALVMTSARSAALDRRLTAIADAQDSAELRSASWRASLRFWMRTAGGVGVLLAAGVLIVVMLKRSR